MITFGGRPLNTYDRIYKGGELQSGNPSTNEFVKQHTKSTPASQSTIEATPADQSKSATEPISPTMKPIVVKVKPELVTIDGPGLFDPPINKDKNANQDPQEFTPDDPFNPKNIDKLTKAIKDREFKNRWVVKLFGKEVALTGDFIVWLCRLLWSLIIFTIIFSICYFLHQITQGVLDAYHIVVDGVTNLMEDINNVAIKFEVPGFNKKIGPFNISMPPLLKVDFKLFGGMFDGPLRDMHRAGEFTRSATDLIIQIIIQMITSIVESLPAISEGIMNALEKIGDAV